MKGGLNEVDMVGMRQMRLVACHYADQRCGIAARAFDAVAEILLHGTLEMISDLQAVLEHDVVETGAFERTCEVDIGIRPQQFGNAFAGPGSAPGLQAKTLSDKPGQVEHRRKLLRGPDRGEARCSFLQKGLARHAGTKRLLFHKPAARSRLPTKRAVAAKTKVFYFLSLEKKTLPCLILAVLKSLCRH